jgi:hypothetical protein
MRFDDGLRSFDDELVVVLDRERRSGTTASAGDNDADELPLLLVAANKSVIGGGAPLTVADRSLLVLDERRDNLDEPVSGDAERFFFFLRSFDDNVSASSLDREDTPSMRLLVRLRSRDGLRSLVMSLGAMSSVDDMME